MGVGKLTDFLFLPPHSSICSSAQVHGCLHTNLELQELNTSAACLGATTQSMDKCGVHPDRSCEVGMFYSLIWWNPWGWTQHCSLISLLPSDSTPRPPSFRKSQAPHPGPRSTKDVWCPAAHSRQRLCTHSSVCWGCFPTPHYDFPHVIQIFKMSSWQGHFSWWHCRKKPPPPPCTYNLISFLVFFTTLIFNSRIIYRHLSIK